jgi:hypothetical protein
MPEVFLYICHPYKMCGKNLHPVNVLCLSVCSAIADNVLVIACSLQSESESDDSVESGPCAIVEEESENEPMDIEN